MVYVSYKRSYCTFCMKIIQHWVSKQHYSPTRLNIYCSTAGRSFESLSKHLNALLKCEFSFLRAHDDSGLETCSLLLSGRRLQPPAPSCRKKGCITPWNRPSLNIWWAAACFWQLHGRPRSAASAVAVLHADEANANTDRWKCSNKHQETSRLHLIYFGYFVVQLKLKQFAENWAACRPQLKAAS